MSPLREAAEVADEVNAALAALGIDVRLVRAVPHVGAHGEPVLWLRLEGARVVARVLRRAGASPGAGVVAFQRVADDRDGELRDGAA
ncbi:hypothetical protein AB0D37_40210 [Streptomyces sp. NPDC048384]|uniref:hypothetical protein n=1 Tax=Streptomyces sp. NPDC048384 TaxID=3155487 RepID=UPI0034143042